ncbi:hypothetical protein OG909_30500 [Streptomyces sp. NBC_01754]|uniref:hypothetical protein n=1 Tax=Streptomyces sp. NBC_01754 TaxID=2975930 RepID=UPI002DDA1743|nr:hypothetical protein [Streptomyces sp. NBC_01754]WSC96284.1 hypothetical protein OG909_30500 [Streptomyces sp. NBC_01754]
MPSAGEGAGPAAGTRVPGSPEDGWLLHATAEGFPLRATPAVENLHIGQDGSANPFARGEAGAQACREVGDVEQVCAADEG